MSIEIRVALSKDDYLSGMSKIGTVLALGFLLISGASGIQNAVNDWPPGPGVGEALYTLFLGSMGVLGVGSAVGATYRRRWASGIMVAWGLSLTLASALAPVVNGDGTPASGVASGLLGAGLAALTYLGVRGRWIQPLGMEDPPSHSPAPQRDG
jgi:hypothetical protein